MNMMKYKGYVAKIEYDEIDRIFVGHLSGIEDIVGFHGSTVDELEKTFHESVDDYLVISEKTGRPAQKPYSGKMTVRVDPVLHAAVSRAAELGNISVNKFISKCLADSVHA